MPHSSLHKYTRNWRSTFFSSFSREEFLVLLPGLARSFCARKGCGPGDRSREGHPFSIKQAVNRCLLFRVYFRSICFYPHFQQRSIGLMSLSSSASDRKRVAVTGAKERSATSTPITLSERSI